MFTHANSHAEKTAASTRNRSRARCGGHSAAVRSMLAFNRLQAKLRVSAPNDRFEQQADRVAEQVVSRGRIGEKIESNFGSVSEPARRMCEECEEEAQRKPLRSSSASQTAPAAVDTAHLGAGRPLSGPIRSYFEPRFGRDFSDIRVFDGAAAARSADSIDARAYTFGPNIVFNAGQYDPGSGAGNRLLAHELTHVVQQGSEAKQVQRSCFDGNCEECDDGWKNLWITVFFARRANRDTMTKLRAGINKSKEILANCCVRLKFDFDWTLIPGAASIETPSRHRRPAGDPLGFFDVQEPLEPIGESDLIAGARGVPMLVVDEVLGTGGATTILGGQDDQGRDFDLEYTGSSMFFLAVNQPVDLGCPFETTIAHELWHITGALRHNAADGAITDCSGEAVAEPYCTAVRGLA